MSARKGVQFVSIEMPVVCWEKIMSTIETQASWWRHLQTLKFSSWVFLRFCLRENYPHAKIKPICLYEGNRSSFVNITPTWNVLPTFSRDSSPSENNHVYSNTCKSVFQFLVRYGCIKCEKSKDFMLVIWLKEEESSFLKTPLNSQGFTSDLSYYLSGQFRSTSEDLALYV